MADNTTIAPQGGGDTIATDDISGVKHQRVKIEYGADGSATDVSPANPLPTATQGAVLTGTSGNISAGGTGTIGPLNVSTAGAVTFIAKNQTAGSAWAGAPVLVFEQSDDSTSWSPFTVMRSDNGVAASTHTLSANSANREIMFDGGTEGVTYVQCRVTTGPTTNPMTVVIQPGALAFEPVVAAVDVGATSITSNGPTSVTSAAADTLILASNPNRRGATITNDSTANLFLSLGTNAASLTAFTAKILAGGYYEVPFKYTGQIRGIWQAANGFARVTEVIP